MESYTQDKQALRTERGKESAFSLLHQINWGESYTSLLLGVLVVTIVFVMVVSFVRAGRGVVSSISTENTETSAVTKASSKAELPPLTYTVLEGDDLASIAEKHLGSKDLWSEIASFNNLSNPDILPAGMVLKIPRAKNDPSLEEPRIEEIPAQKITGNTYTVLEGDLLWDIAVRAYGDGFRWQDIVKANNLQNPDILSAGSILKIPR